MMVTRGLDAKNSIIVCSFAEVARSYWFTAGLSPPLAYWFAAGGLPAVGRWC